MSGVGLAKAMKEESHREYEANNCGKLRLCLYQAGWNLQTMQSGFYIR